jgi:hypothetical protein
LDRNLDSRKAVLKNTSRPSPGGGGHEVSRGSMPLSGADVSWQKVNLGVKASGGGGGGGQIRQSSRPITQVIARKIATITAAVDIGVSCVRKKKFTDHPLRQ